MADTCMFGIEGLSKLWTPTPLGTPLRGFNCHQGPPKHPNPRKPSASVGYLIGFLQMSSWAVGLGHVRLVQGPPGRHQLTSTPRPPPPSTAQCATHRGCGRRARTGACLPTARSPTSWCGAWPGRGASACGAGAGEGEGGGGGGGSKGRGVLLVFGVHFFCCCFLFGGCSKGARVDSGVGHVWH